MTLAKEETIRAIRAGEIGNFSQKIQNVKYNSGYKETETTKAWTSSPYQSYQDLKSGKGLLIFQQLTQISKCFYFPLKKNLISNSLVSNIYKI